MIWNVLATVCGTLKSLKPIMLVFFLFIYLFKALKPTGVGKIAEDPSHACLL